MGRYVFTRLNFVGSVFADGALLLLVDSTAFNSQEKEKMTKLSILKDYIMRIILICIFSLTD